MPLLAPESLSHQEMHRGCWKIDHIGVNVGRSKGMSFGSTCQRERERNCQCFYETAMSSTTVPQVKLPCARSDALRDQKSTSNSRSTTTWRRGRLIRGSLLLCVCVLSQFHFTHYQLLQYNALLPRVYVIETDAALRDSFCARRVNSWWPLCDQTI